MGLSKRLRDVAAASSCSPATTSRNSSAPTRENDGSWLRRGLGEGERERGRGGSEICSRGGTGEDIARALPGFGEATSRRPLFVGTGGESSEYVSSKITPASRDRAPPHHHLYRLEIWARLLCIHYESTLHVRESFPVAFPTSCLQRQ